MSMEEEEHVCALCFPPKKEENSAGVAASETGSPPQTPKQQPQEQSDCQPLFWNLLLGAGAGSTALPPYRRINSQH